LDFLVSRPVRHLLGPAARTAIGRKYGLYLQPTGRSESENPKFPRS
jgi:hypothetical protein